MNKNSTSTGVIILGGLAFLLIIFSFFAPYLFTGESSYDRYNFTQTGPIGDTIGGLMNPFIAIAGVIMTFLAFLMQVRANEIQRKQFLETLQKEDNKEKWDSFYNLQILAIDIDNIIKNINTNIDSIDKFIAAIKENPYNTCILLHTPLKQYDRIKQIPRQFVFRGFDLYIRPLDKDWTLKFNGLYNTIDFVPECLENLYSIVQHHNDDTFNIKNKLREDFIELDNKCYNIINSTPKPYSSLFYSEVSDLLQKHREEIKKSKENNKEGDLKIHKQILEKFNRTIEPVYLSYDSNTTEKKLLHLIQGIILEINHIEQLSNQIVPEVKKVRQILNDNENSSKNKLTRIKELINKAIETSKTPTSK